MRLSLIIIFVFAVFLSRTMGQTYTLPGLTMWLRSDSLVTYDTVNRVALWQDASGNNNNAQQINVNEQPVFTDSIVLLNNKPVLRFDGSNDFLQITDNSTLDFTSEFTIIFIAKQDILASDKAFICKWDYGTQSSWAIQSGPNSGITTFVASTLTDIGINNVQTTNTSLDLNKYCIFTIRYDGSLTNENRVKIYVDSLFSATSTSNTIVTSLINSTADIKIGTFSGLSRFFNGDFAEILMYNRSLSEAERMQTEQNLRYKYAPSVDLGQDIHSGNFCPVTIDAGEGFVNYVWSTTGLIPGDTLDTLVVTQPGTYSVTATDVFGFTSVDSVNVFFPFNGFNDTILCFGSSSEMNALLDGSYDFLWSTGDIDSAITVTDTGQYWIMITDLLTCSYSDTFKVLIDSFAVTTTLGPDSTSFCSGNSISLANGASSADQYLWSDSSSETSLSILISGDYSLTVTNDLGCIAIDTIHVDITGTGPYVDFIADTVCLGSPTTFTNLSAASDSVIWDFGDNDTSALVDPLHTYDLPGTYAVELTQFQGGCPNTIQKDIVVKTIPQSDFSFGQACVDMPVFFTNLSFIDAGDSIVSFLWDFDGLATSTDENPSHYFTGGGTHSVSLTAISSNQCQDEITKQINVDTIAIPADISLLFPANNAVISDTNINFTWDGINAVKYIFQLSENISFTSIVFSDTLNQTQISKELSLINNQELFWKIIGFNYCDGRTETGINKLTFYNPSLDSGNILWLRSDSGLIKTSNLIYGWQDISGNDNDAWQMNTAERPIFVDSISILNYKPILCFDGLNDFMGIYDNNSLDFNDEFTMIFISKQTVATSDKAYICKWNYQVQSSWAVQTGSPGGVKAFIANTQTDIGINYVQTTNASLDLCKYNIYTIKYDGNQSTNNRIKMHFNTSPLSITTSGTIVSALLNSAADLKIGTFEVLGRFFNGEFAEILLYNRALSDLERYQAEQYLHYKYAPPVNLGADIYTKNFCPVIIEASDRYIDYYWNTPDISPGDISDVVVSKSGQYSVTVTDVFGFTSTDSINVHFPEEIRDTSFCANDSIILTPPFSENYTYLWSNLSTTEQTVFYTGGICWLETTDDSLCSRRDTFIIDVDSISYIATLGNDTTLCAGNFLSLLAGQQEAVSYTWTPGGETTSSLMITDSGTYGLTVWSSNGCVATDSIFVNVQGFAPLANFTIQNQCFGDSLVFTDASTSLDLSNIVQWKWVFHDGQIISGDSVVKKKYDAPGIYPVTLTIGTDSSCSASVTLQVQVYYLPEPDFDRSNPCSDHPIQLINLSTVLGGAHIEDYLWIVNNTDTFDLENPSYNAGGPGLISVYLRTTSNHGCVDDTTRTIQIKQSPLCQFDVSPSCSERKTYFFDLSESDVIHPITDWYWDFGVAGAFSDMQNPDYIYTLPGDYNVTLQVINLWGCPDKDSLIVQVSASPRAGFTGDKACVGVPVQLVDTSIVDNGYIYQRNWDIPGIGTFSDNVINVIFNQNGNFEVSLEVISELNCRDEVTGIINVYSLPEAAFEVSDSIGPFPLIAEFTNESDPGLYLWDFGDSTESQLENPSHLYADTGSYHVVLSVTDANGCVQQTGQTILVVENLYDLAIFDMDTIVNGNLRNIGIVIANMGTLPVENPYLLVNLPNSQPFTETVNLTLEPGDTPYYYIMTTGIYVNEATDRSYICAEIVVPPAYGVDIDESNNEYCLTSGTGLDLLRIYPNPATDGIIIEFSSGSNTDADIIINTVRGQKISQQNVAVQKGFNRINLDIRTYTSGVYFLSIRHKDGVVIDKFVKSR